MTTLFIATRNGHKVREIREVLGDQFTYWSLRDFAAAPPVKEDAGTFAGNATKKAAQLAAWLWEEVLAERVRMPPAAKAFVLADDSGLEVDALAGAPGVHSARFAAAECGVAGNAADAANNAKLLRLLAEVVPSGRTARFRCVIALTVLPGLPIRPSAYGPGDWAMWTQLFEGVCGGQIGFAPRGQGGFGYDPLFIPAGYAETFAQLGEGLKNQMSHRARALAKLREQLAGASRWPPPDAGDPPF